MNNPLSFSIPTELENLIKGYSFEPVTIGESGASVYRLQMDEKPSVYLKVAPANSPFPLEPEVARLEWLKGRLPVPEVLFYRQDTTGEYLLTTEVAGKMAFDSVFESDVTRVVKSLAAGLKMLHSLDISDCPFDVRLANQLEAARQRTEARQVDETNFDDERLGKSAAEVYAELVRTRPVGEDLVFTHGDHCLPNVIFDPATFALSGFIDLGRCGIADRYQDLALAVRSLIRNWGSNYVPLLLEEYGLKGAEIDWGKIEFYKILDEFF